MEDKSYLDQLMDYMNENSRKRDEESLSLVDTPRFGMPLTKKLRRDNPGIPESDISDYRNNVRDDLTDNIMNSTMTSSGVVDKATAMAQKAPGFIKNIGAGIENRLSKLPENSRFRELLDAPAIQKFREPLKQQNAINNANKNAAEMDLIRKESNLAMQQPINPARELDEVSKARIGRDVDLQMAIRNQEAEQEALSKSIPKSENLEETINLFKKKAK